MMKSNLMCVLALALLAGCQAQINSNQPRPGSGPSLRPSATPSAAPSAQPTASPSARPSGQPSATPSSSASSHSVSDEKSLVDHLKMEGADVRSGEAVEQPFLSVKGKTYTVNGETIQVYEYASAQALESDASQISPDGGSTRTTMISWIDDPHFFKQGRVLVLYIGKNQALLNLLQGALGAQFAGR